jgi:uncharacterized protein YegP (UPF0339 family)
MAKKTNNKKKAIPQPMNYGEIRFELYPDAASEWRWRMVDGNNRVVGVSGEGYTRKADVKRAIENIMMDLANPEKPMGLTVAKKVKW